MRCGEKVETKRNWDMVSSKPDPVIKIRRKDAQLKRLPKKLKPLRKTHAGLGSRGFCGRFGAAKWGGSV